MSKDYHINFYGSLPEQQGPGGFISKDKIHYRADRLDFDTKQDMMEFFENPEKISKHLQNTGVVKMMIHNYQKKLIFEPTVMVIPYYQSADGQRIYEVEGRTVDLGFPPLTQKILNGEGL